MQRRKLADTISEDAILARLGTSANLVWDRLLTITDEAGLCAGEPEVVKGKCFPMIKDMDQGKIKKAIDAFVGANLMCRGEWNGRIVLCFNPESFQSHQGFRKDYKRKFDYGDLSQSVWEKGMRGFTASLHGSTVDPNESTAMVSVSDTDTGSDTGTGKGAPAQMFPIPVELNKYLDEIQGWFKYKGKLPQKGAPTTAIINKMLKLGTDLPACIDESMSNQWAGLFPLKGGPNGKKGRGLAPTKKYDEDAMIAAQEEE